MKDTFVEKITEEKEKQKKYELWHKRFGYLKILDIVLFVLSIYSYTKTPDLTPILFAIVFFEGFILLMVCHNKAVMLLNTAKRMEMVYSDYIDRIEGTWHDFKDTGEEFIPKEHDYSLDIDILGKNSLYQMLSTANTYFGRKYFAEDLLNLPKDKEEVQKRQEAVWEMSENLTFITEFQGHTSKSDRNINMDKIIDLLEGDRKLNKINILDYILIGLPIFSVLFTVIVVILKIKSLYMVGFSLFAFQLVLWFLGFIKKLNYLSDVSNAKYKLNNFVDIFKMIEGRTFESNILIKLKENFIKGNKKSSEAIRDLNIIIECINIRSNGMLYFFLNMFLLWDYACIFALKVWRDKYQNYVKEWFRSVGQIESLMSFANLKLIEEDICMPEINNEKNLFGEEMGHPLIKKGIRINNSFSMEKEIFIVSGSNMSGKTTFLRTIGVNFVLGLNGGFVLAKDMKLPILHLTSSMRNIDDLKEGTSTFYAELKKIKNVLESSKTGETLFLIDEIFKGTNSIDRLKGAEAVINKLSSYKALGLITTHDLELCDMAEGSKSIKNYSFCEYYEGGSILFDYKLKEGKAKSTNAKYLMEMLEIL